MKKPHKDQWLADLVEGLRAKPLLPGHLYEIDVFHAYHCPFLVRGGPCKCNPDIEIRDITSRSSSPDGK